MPRQGRTVGLVIAVVTLAACALLLWMIVRSSGDDGAAAGPAPPPPGPARGEGAGHPAARGEGASRPGLPQVAASSEDRRGGGAAEPATETIVNGVRVRDHRRDRTKPIVLPDRPPMSGARRLPNTLTSSISDQLLPIVRECGAAVPPEARGPKPRVEGQLLVAIKDHRLALTSVTVELSGVVGATLEPARQCIQQKGLALTLPAPDEDDVENYPIQISLALL